MKAAAILLMTVCAALSMANASTQRSKKVLREFVNQQACPATGANRMPCPGYHIDHIAPLCAGGVDAVENLQWLTREAHKEKTRIDVSECRARLKP